MRHISAAHDLAQNALSDTATLAACSCWVTDLAESARRELDENWQGIFRRSRLKRMPAAQLGRNFHPSFGRPTKELPSMAALVFIMECKNLTLAADTAYGSAENHEQARSQGIELISPVPGRAPQEGVPQSPG